MKLIMLSIPLILALLSASCSPSPSDSSPEGKFQSLNHDSFDSYTSTFVILFDGPVKWVYQLESRRAGKLSEKRLHIEGISGAQNPGDIRMVTDGVTSWMTGPGTDDECIQFPNGQGMDPSWITPETLVSVSSLEALLKPTGEAEITGRQTEGFSGRAGAIDSWKNARVDVWLEKSSQGLMQYNMQATGEDPLFGTGSGLISARYIVESLDPPAIEPVPGCGISVPVPDSATMFVRLPGLASFDSGESVEEISAFYQQELPAAGWTEREAPTRVEGATVLSYTRANEQVDVQIVTSTGSGAAVKLLFSQIQ